MQLELTVRHFELSDNYKEYALQEVENLSQYWDRIVDGQIVFDQEGNDYMVEVILRVSGKTLAVSAQQGDVMKAIDDAVNKMRRRLKKYKGKIISHS
ncbi:MAG: ribosome-associated translation inhibitor RaiA [Candidatus Marinimicrobia bacterium]|nr:ribosome-associated translation inhibitor RaiA [Candidatus Neomarinimicrobiota bacterium]MCF7830079.1 ribosome-associated translation inhibitor RaiA [Candidatus Neomarinimicrobiota bacterium]MCF7882126.1 ribosome-associated translation inhibitor RaiA [Candidatus Neomarinimicrobiota bacterium]